MDLDLGCVSGYLVLLEEQQYARAAARLHLTSSALSKRVQRLERQVGATLVARGPDGTVVPTPEGLRFSGPAARMLADAEEARRAVREPGSVPRVVLGVPAGPQQFLRGPLRDAVRQLRCAWPGTGVLCRAVPFPALTSCLLDEHVDVLWTAAPVRHPAVVSDPLQLGTPRIGLVSREHELADAGAVAVEEFAALPMLYNPSIPDEWMSVFYLGDVRPRRDAELVSADPRTMAAVARASVRRRTVVVAPGMLALHIPAHLRTVSLNGAPPIVFHVAHRRSERRDTVLTFVAALRSAR